jgi:lipopolysaccharide export system permease protein
MLVDYVEGTRKFSTNSDISSITVFIFTLLRTPQLLEETVPFIVLFGIMGSLHNLNQKSELIVLRAAGLSVWKFLSPIIIISGLFGILWSTMLNPLASHSSSTQSEILNELGMNSKTTDIWLSEGSQTNKTIIHAEKYNEATKTIFDVTYFIFDINTRDELKFVKRIDASRAILLKSGYWQLHDVKEVNTRGLMKKKNVMSFATTVTEVDLINSINKNKLPSFWEITNEIRRRENNGFSVTTLDIQYNKLLSLPLMLIAMSILASCVTLNHSRQGNTAKLIILGALLGFTIYISNNLMISFAKSETIPPFFATWFVPTFALLFGTTYLSIIEDG